MRGYYGNYRTRRSLDMAGPWWALDQTPRLLATQGYGYAEQLGRGSGRLKCSLILLPCLLSQLSSTLARTQYTLASALILLHKRLQYLWILLHTRTYQQSHIGTYSWIANICFMNPIVYKFVVKNSVIILVIVVQYLALYNSSRVIMEMYKHWLP